jgi:hypothetical protein
MARADPYQARARELAREAGLDPDGRIERPGQRSMPVWCTFREAARAARMKRETDATAAVIAITPQAAEFRDRPLEVFGKHDEATIAQIRNCMGVGNVAAGVICADGHLGYARPVGGVIAYEKQISISGVASTSPAATWRCDWMCPTPPSPTASGRLSGISCKQSRSVSAGPMRSGSSMNCSTMRTLGARATWKPIGTRPRPSSAPSERATITST